MKNSFLKHFFVLGFGTIVSMLISIITTPLITRLVGTDTYGQFSIFSIYANIGVMVLCLGLDQGIIRFYYEDDSLEYKRTLIRACVFLPIIATCIVTVISIFLNRKNVISFEFGNIGLVLLGLFVAIQIVNRLNFVQLRSAYKTREYNIVNISNKVSYLFFVVFLIVFLKVDSLFSLIIGSIGSYLIASIIGISIQKREWKFWHITYNKKFNYKELYKYSAPYIISMGVTTLFQAIDKISLNKYCTYSEVGIYAAAMNIISIFAIVQTTFNILWTPMVIEHYQNDSNDCEFYMKGNRMITVVMFFIGVTLIMCKDIFVLLLGENYRKAAVIIPFLIFNPIMYTISETTVIGIVFKKKSNMQIVIAVISCITNIVGNTLLVPILGGRGAAISTGISYIVFFSARTLIANQYFKVDWKLGRFWKITVLVILYALYNTFGNNYVISIIGYVIIISALVILYKETVVEFIQLGKKEITNFINRN